MSAVWGRLGFILLASRKEEKHLDKDLIVKEEKQVQELLSTLLKRATNASDVLVFHLELGGRGQNTCRKEGFDYPCLSVSVPTARSCLLTPFQQLSKATSSS